MTKADLLENEELKKLKKVKLKNYDGKIIVFSSASKYGLEELLDKLWAKLNE